MSSLRVGTTNLPSLLELQGRVARGGHVNPYNLPVNSRLFYVDTETTGVSDIDVVRSISVGEGRLRDAGGVKTVEIDRTADLGARFETAQMSSYVSADPHDLRRVTGLGTAVIEKETRFATAPKELSDRIFDLRTEPGREKARQYYTDLLTRMSEDDAFMVAQNGQFDVGMKLRTARSLGVDEGVLSKFEKRMANGGLVDVLGLVREKLNNKLVERLAKAKGTPEQKAIMGLQAMFSNKALQQARDAGEALKGFGLENLIESTNLLEILGQEVQSGSREASDLLSLLSSSQASHVDFTDRRITEKVVQYLHEDKLDFLFFTGETNVSPEVRKAINASRLNTASSRAIIGITNLADPRYLTQAAFENLITTEQIRGVEIDAPMSAVIQGGSEQVSTLKFDPNTGSFRFFSPNPNNPIGPSIATDLPKGFNAEQFIRDYLKDVRSTPFDSPIQLGKPVIQTLGISALRGTNIEFTNQLLTGGAAPLIDAIGSNIVANEEALIKGLVATGQIGFNALPETAGFSGDITRLMRGPHDPITDQARSIYQRTLYEAGIASASMDPAVRSTLVGISGVTSPLMAENTRLLTSAVTEEGISEAQIAGRVESLSGQLASRGRYTRELGAVTARTQKEIVSGESITLLPRRIIERAKTIDDSGNVVSFLSDEALSSRGNVVRMSIARRSTEELSPTVNFIYGGRLVSGGINIKKRNLEAMSLYRSTVKELDSLGRSPEAMIEAGLATTRQQALQILSDFRPLKDAAGKSSAEGLRSFRSFRSKYLDRGVGLAATIRSDNSEQIVSLIQGLVGTADTDTLAAQRGLLLSVADANEDLMTFVPRISEEAVTEAKRVGGAGIDLATRASATKQREFLKSVLKRGAEDPKFFGRVQKAFSSARIDAGVGGTSVLADRAVRNQYLIDKITKIKPGVFKGLAAVTALSAGYYLGKREQKDDLYEQVMDQQPTETNIGRMGIADFNALDQQLAAQSSSRRDPLVTAGVVGNLDRNKISHTRMGSDKYNHLFGA